MEKFVKALPMLPKEIQEGASDVVALLQGRNMIKQITFDDIIGEMRGRCFEEEEMVECLKWRVGLPRQAAFDAHFRDQFVTAGIFRIPPSGSANAGDDKGVNLVISHVPGPRQTVYWQGCKLTGIYPVSMLIDGIALNITLTSRHDFIDFGLIACRKTLPHMQRLLDYLEQSLRELEVAAA